MSDPQSDESLPGLFHVQVEEYAAKIEDHTFSIVHMSCYDLQDPRVGGFAAGLKLHCSILFSLLLRHQGISAS
jgi:hypothetical protein